MSFDNDSNRANNVESSPFIEKPEHNDMTNNDDAYYASMMTPIKRGSQKQVTPLKLQESSPSLFSSRSKKEALQKESSLQKELNATKYELNSLKNEQDRLKLRAEDRVRELENKLKEESKRSELLSSDQAFLFEKQNQSNAKLNEMRNTLREQKLASDKMIRDLKIELGIVQDGNAELESSLRSEKSLREKEKIESESSLQALQKSSDDLLKEIEAKSNDAINANSKVLELEGQIISLKDQLAEIQHKDDEKEVADMLNRELSEQVNYIKSLELKVKAQTQELELFRDTHRSVELVEEEKKSLEVKVSLMEQLRQQVAEYELQILNLEEDQQKWKSYLSKDDQFKNPEDFVKLLSHERMEKVILLEKVGRITADSTAKDDRLGELETEVKNIKQERDELQLRLDIQSDNCNRAERQRDIATQEAQLLKQQINSFDVEESVFSDGKYDQQKSLRISQLEELVTQYKSEIAALSSELKMKSEGLLMNGTPIKTPSKRFHDADDDHGHEDKIKGLSHRNKNLQVQLEVSRAEISKLKNDIQVLRNQISHMEESTKTRHRILELRENPTSKHENVKKSMIDCLRKENDALLIKAGERASSNETDSENFVPGRTLERLRLEMKEMEAQLESKEKLNRRLRDIFGAKSLEFREAIYALLGYKVDILPNKKVRATSMFSKDNENEALIFIADGKSKGKKFVGIEDSSLTQEYKNLFEFWVKERKNIPCFLAGLNLELYEKMSDGN
ncbi:MAD-domain-containing protein [Nadsonia fulvescens var. elongata DSM 6958]|uniref:Spindle assembly checkpoint component MAD1 n=1 Tax=Nadsonia fulvescens var. elongata DSM 6958 TaxID=857566 RepID=A0A1E3PUA8_9ASCO|nr:MAD-domain-containing protein [Nadsonia fulvescens var. elongata DSM 6958]